MSSTIVPPRPGPPKPLHLPAIHRRTLKNGLRVLTIEQRDLPIVDVHLFLRTGAAQDPVDAAGLTSLAADMLDEGAGGRNAIELAEAVENLGAALYSSAGWDNVGLSIHVHSDRLDPALHLLADVVLRPSLLEADFRRRQEQRLNQLLQETAEPRILAANAFNAVVFGDEHPYGRPLHGNRQTVNALTREAVVAYHETFVRPSNAFVVAAGDVDAEAFVAQIEAIFGNWVDAPLPPRSPLPAPQRQGTAIHIVDRPGSGQSEVRIGTVGAPRVTPDHFALVVMNTIFGGAFTSRLNMNLRQERGYTYGAGSSFGFRREAGPFVASTAVSTDATEDTVRQVLHEMARLRNEMVPADELERARSYIALGFPRTFETSADIAGHVAEIESYGLGDAWFDDYIRRIREVTADDVMRVARTYVDPTQVAIVIAGDRATIEAPLRSLDVGPVHVRAVEE